MERIAFESPPNIYHQYDFITDDEYMNNRLLATFVQHDDIDNLIDKLIISYEIMYNKMFVLFIKSTNEYVVTYNVEQANVGTIPSNTILVHRKKESNTLYTINALNDLIKKLNGGIVDPNFRINWQYYRNCILLTQHGEVKQLNTKIFKIIEL